MLNGSSLRGYTPYAQGLRSGPAGWIILWMAHKGTLPNPFILFGAMKKIPCLILPTIHVYNAGISQLLSYAWLRSYARLWLEDVTPVVCPTPVVYLNSGHTSRLRSTSQLRSYLLTPVAHHGSGRRVGCMSYHLSCERLYMGSIDDCSILQPKHLVRSKLGWTHDSFSIWNLSIPWLRMFKCQTMCRATDRQLAQLNLRETRAYKRTRYHWNSGGSRSLNICSGVPRLYAVRPWH
jgi:hypothetical protein